jgi:hypothetical protein
MSLVVQFEALCQSLFKAYTSDQSNTLDIIEQLFGVINSNDTELVYAGLCDIEVSSYPLIALTFNKIGGLMNVPFNVLCSNGKIMTTKTTTLKSMFDELKLTHYHQDVEIDGVKHSCNFHEESLFTHLHMAALVVACQKIVKAEEDLLVPTFAALMHDIGKPACMHGIEFEKSKSLAYQFHGELGAGMMGQIYNDKFAEFINKSDWEDMCRLICVHMCSYHSIDFTTFNSKYKTHLARLESPRIQKLLRDMSVGDHFGAFRAKDHEESPIKFVESRYAYMDAISVPFLMERYLAEYGTKGFVIFVRGMSGSGKSTLIRKIVTHLKEHSVPCRVVERDEIVCKVASKFIGTPYEGDRPVGDEYSRLRKIYEDNKLAGQVGDVFKAEIVDGIASGEVVIIDTMMTYFKGIMFNVPSVIKNAFVMAIDVVRGVLLTDADGARIGVTLHKQIEIHSDRSEWSWLPSSVKPQFRDLSSRCTANDVRNGISLARPHIVHVITWNDYATIGEEHMFSQLDTIVEPMKRIVEIKINTDEMDIIQYFNHMYKINGFDATCLMISEQRYLVHPPSQFRGTPLEKEFVRIVYLESNRDWRKKWGRQARGIILYKTEEDVWIPIKYHLQRGAESLTGMHVRHGLNETQDMTIKGIDIFDDVQQDTMNKLLTGDEINVSMSFKVDGSLLGVTAYRGKLGAIMGECTLKYGDDFAKAVYNVGKRIAPDLTFILSTQTTLYMGEHMQDYNVTALLVGFNIVTEDALAELAKTMTPAQVFETYGEEVMDRFKRLIEGIDGDVVSVSCESVCKNRISAWSTLHTELAVSYESSFIRVLGVSVCSPTSIIWKPHYEYSELLAYAELMEPLYWMITNTKMIESMLTDLSLVIRKRMTEGEFLDKYPPNNAYDTMLYFDWEGFVGLRTDRNYDYFKIKTEEYYNSHKFTYSKIPYLIDLSETASNIFPLCGIVANFFTTLKPSLLRAYSSIAAILGESIDTNRLFATMPDKAKGSFAKQSVPVKYRMLINASTNFNEIAQEVFYEVFPALAKNPCDPNEIVATLKAIVMKFQPWLGNLDEGGDARISEMINTHDETLQTLFGHCYNSTGGDE